MGKTARVMDGARDRRKHWGQKLQHSTPWRPKKNMKRSLSGNVTWERVRADIELDDYFRLDILLQEGNILSKYHKTVHAVDIWILVK